MARADVIADFTEVAKISDMPTAEICSFCYAERNAMMQRTAYSQYGSFFKPRLEYINTRCGKTANTTIPASLVPLPDTSSFCVSGQTYTTSAGETCDSIALALSLSSAALQMANNLLVASCNFIPAETTLCLPLGCAKTYTIQPDDICFTIEQNRLSSGTRFGDVRKFNPWVDWECSNLVTASDSTYGHVICLSPQNGQHEITGGDGSTTTPPATAGYSRKIVVLPEDAVLAPGSTWKCGVFYTAVGDDICAAIAVAGPTTIDILMMVNPSLGTDPLTCNSNIVPGLTYCALPAATWNDIYIPDAPPTTTITIGGPDATPTDIPSSAAPSSDPSDTPTNTPRPRTSTS